jgi:hypothetical protein
MTNRDETPANHSHARSCEAPSRNLRDKLNGACTTGIRRDRFHFRSLKRLCLPPRALSPRLAPNL